MEKLLKLLNEYCTEEEIKYKWNFVPNHLEWEACDNSECSDLLIVSKKYWFIKRLVENNKIDRLTFCTVETPSSKYEDFDLWPETPREDYTNILLMDLAIQDNPIEFLISILK